MDERLEELQRAYKGYKVCDEHYEKLGKVEEVLVDASGQPMYVGIRMSLLKPEATLIPMELVRVNDKRQLIEAARPRYVIEHAPTLEEHEEITPEFEEGVRSYFGLPDRWDTPGSTIQPPPDTGPDEDPRVDLEPGERKSGGEAPPASGPHLDSEPTPSERRLRRVKTLED